MMTDAEKDHIRVILDWRDLVLKTCNNVGMSGDEQGAYLLLCRAIGKVPVIRGEPRPDLVEEPKAQAIERNAAAARAGFAADSHKRG